MEFREDYGASSLDQYDLFGDQRIMSYGEISLRGGSGTTAPSAQIGDQFIRRLQEATGSPMMRSEFRHVFINGIYWGMYSVSQLPLADFQAQIYGGDPDDYDVIRGPTPGIHTGLNVEHGNADRFNELITTAEAVPTFGTFSEIEALLDVDHFIDYLLTNIFSANTDWGGRNMYVAARSRDGDADFEGKFRFFSWDGDSAFPAADADVSVAPNNSSDPLDRLFHGLRKYEEFRLRFADHVHEHFFNGGVMTPDAAARLLNRIAAESDRGFASDAAAWRSTNLEGDRQRVQHLLGIMLNGTTRTQIVLNQLRSPVALTGEPTPLPLYPSTDAAEFLIGGVRQHGGSVGSGAELTFELPTGFSAGSDKIYYTLNGTDPRDGNDDILYTIGMPIVLTSTTEVFARVRKADGEWSAATRATFDAASDQRLYLRISEIMYNPPEQTHFEQASSGNTFPQRNDFEFVELVNVSDTVEVDLAGVQLMVSPNVNYRFGNETLGPRERIVIANNRDGFLNRYGDRDIRIADGSYTGNLSDSGEDISISIMDIANVEIHSVEYDANGDDRWYLSTDGHGYTLVARDIDLAVDNDRWDDLTGWRPSDTVLGSPGESDTALRGVVFHDADGDDLRDLGEDTNGNGILDDGEDQNNNNRLDVADRGIEGIEITAHFLGLDADGLGFPVPFTLADNRSWTTRTDENGFYSFSGLTAGYYRVEVENRAGLTLVQQDKAPAGTLPANIDRVEVTLIQ